jgi:hypothetical protein
VADPGLGEQLLLDMRDIITEHGRGVGPDLAMHTRDIIERLVQMEERTWTEFGKARLAIRDFEVKRLLEPFELVPEQVQIGGREGPNRRGYRLAHVHAAVERYIHSRAPTGARPQDGGENPNEPKGAKAPPSSTVSARRVLDAIGARPENVSEGGLAARPKPGARRISEPDQRSSASSASSGDFNEIDNSAVSDPSNGQDGAVELSTGGCEFAPTGEWRDVPPGVVLPPGLQVEADLETGRQRCRWPPGRCIDCGAEVPKPSRGPTAKRCKACRDRRRPPKVEPGVVFE